MDEAALQQLLFASGLHASFAPGNGGSGGGGGELFAAAPALQAQPASVTGGAAQAATEGAAAIDGAWCGPRSLDAARPGRFSGR